jgi:hypothetical protein
VKRSLLLGALVFIAPIASSEAPPTQPFTSIDWPATMSKKPTNGITLGTFRVQFETTTLSDVQRAAAAGQISQNSENNVAEHILWLCYTSPHSGAIDRIWILSDPEMGGDTHLVTGVTVARVAEGSTPSDCPSLPRTMQPVSLDIPVWVGSTDSVVTAALGSSSHRHGAWSWFNFQTKSTEDGKCEGGYDLGNWLLTKSVSGHVALIFAGQVTSC